MYIHVNIFKIYGVYLHIHNKYTQYIYNVNKTFILDAINRLTALNIISNQI